MSSVTFLRSCRILCRKYPYIVSDLILSLDIGTSSTRASLYDTETMTTLPNAFRALSHSPEVTSDGGAWLDPDELVQEVLACISAVLPYRDGRTIRAVGISTFWHSAIGVDENGERQTPVLLWADRRASAQVAHLKEALDTKAYTDRTGCPLHTSYLPARLMYLRDNEPDVWKKCYRFLSPGEYLLSKLFDTHDVCCSPSMASGTGLYDARSKTWDTETLAQIGLSADNWSPVADKPMRGLAAAFQERLAPLGDVPFFPALGDGACSNVGCGASEPGKMALMIGTSGALRAVTGGTSVPAVPPGLWRYLIGPGRYLLGGALSNGGSVWAWLKDTLPLPDDNEKAEVLIGAIAPDSHGLTVLPFLAGERAPLWRDDLRGSIIGLSEATTPIDIARAYLEAVAYRFAALHEAVRATTGTGQLVGTGAGLLASKVWAQIVCDALGEPLLLSSEEQASSRGAALWAYEQSGGYCLEDAPPVNVKETLQPSLENMRVYTEARKRQEDLLKRLL